MEMSTPIDVETVTFVHVPPEWEGGWHTTPVPQFVISFSGELEVKTTVGQSCRIGRGDLILLEDASGKGHHAEVVGDDVWRGLLIKTA